MSMLLYVWYNFYYIIRLSDIAEAVLTKYSVVRITLRIHLFQNS